jgi:hypothetical protein
MSAITGGFDAVLEIAAPALERAARAMHQAGNLSHGAVHIHNGSRFEFGFGAPRLELDASSHQDARARCIARTRVICRTQPADDPYAAVESAVVSLALRGRFELPAGDPALIDLDSAIAIDWSETTASDVVVHSGSPTVVVAIRDALLDMTVSSAAALFAIGHLRDAGVTSMALVVVPGAAEPPALGIGLNLTGTAGVRAAVPYLLTQDWVAAIDAEVIGGQILAALAQRLGGTLPPPHGPSPVLVDESTICAFQTPFGCAHAQQRTYLDALIVELTTAGVRFRADVRRETDSFFAPPISASWDATVALGVSPHGSLSATLGVSTVHLNEWYAVIANLLTANRLELAVRDGVQQALDAGLGANDPAGMLGVLVNQLATAGRTANAALSPRPTSVESRSEALLVHGVIDHGLPAPAPVARLVAVATPTPGELLLTAGASWAPGDDVVAYDWEFGDGTTSSSAGTNASFAAEHTYPPGSYSVCVEVIDSQGRSARHCISVQPGRLAIEHLPDGTVSNSPWQACVTDRRHLALTFEVTSCDSRLPGVTVTASGNGWQTSAVTDARGRATLTLDPAHAIPPPAGTHSSFAEGSFTIEASQTGFDSAIRELELLDCDALGRIILDTKRQFEDRIDRLVGYQALRDLIASGIGKQVIPPAGLPDHPAKPHLERRVTADEIDAISVGVGTRVLSDLVQLLELNRDAFPVHALLGLDPNEKGFAVHLERRLDIVWRSLDAAARRLADPPATWDPGAPDPPRVPDPR